MSIRGQNRSFVHFDDFGFYAETPEETASRLFGVPVENVTNAQRSFAKTVRFPHVYGSANPNLHHGVCNQGLGGQPTIVHQLVDLNTGRQIFMKDATYKKIVAQISALFVKEPKPGD